MTEDEKNGITDTSLNQTTGSTSTPSHNTNHHPFASSSGDLMDMLHDETMRQLEFAWEAERKLVALCVPKVKPNPVSAGSDLSSNVLGNLDDDDANANKNMMSNN